MDKIRDMMARKPCISLGGCHVAQIRYDKGDLSNIIMNM